MKTSKLERLGQIVALVDREDQHLQGVRQRLLGDSCTVTTARLDTILHDDAGIDRLESFGAKFARMQDTVVDKLVPNILSAAGESVAAAIDNLSRLERLQLIESADDWLAMRGLRNLLVHEYIDNTERLALTLERACIFTGRMHADYTTLRRYAVDRLAVVAPMR